MTHSNHRRGSRESLEEDYVILVRETKDRQAEAVRALEILSRHNPVGLIKRRVGVPLRYMTNWGGGNSIKELIKGPDPPQYIAGVYRTKQDVLGVVNDLVKAELGFSTVVSGIFDNVFDICKKAGTGPHTVNLSMETIGRTELLPEDRILEITTMCGHSLVSQYLVRYLIDRVRKGMMTAEDASLELGKQCVCNFFNPYRAKKIIDECVARQR